MLVALLLWNWCKVVMATATNNCNVWKWRDSWDQQKHNAYTNANTHKTFKVLTKVIFGANSHGDYTCNVRHENSICCETMNEMLRTSIIFFMDVGSSVINQYRCEKYQRWIPRIIRHRNIFWTHTHIIIIIVMKTCVMLFGISNLLIKCNLLGGSNQGDH